MSMRVSNTVVNQEYAESSLTIVRPDDWHLHLRDGEAMQDVLRHSAERFGRALIMPNLKPPVTDVSAARLYRERIVAAASRLGLGDTFEPLMTLYLTDNTTPKDVEEAAKSGLVTAFKLYPAGATTNSAAGVTDMTKISGAVAAMEEHDLPLCIHGEQLCTDEGEEIDVFDREDRFLTDVLHGFIDRYPKQRFVLEHVTTAAAVKFVKSARPGVAATITAHHLLENRNAIFRGGIRPHYYCLPILKRERDREELLLAATSGSPKFFLGTDSAPHAQGAKESACGCAGCCTAHAGIELYVHALELFGALDELEGFASHFGADFYGLPRNTRTITLVKKPWKVPMSYPFGDDVVVPFWAGNTINWRVEGLEYPS